MKKTKFFKLIGIAGISLVIASSSVAMGFAATATSKAVSASYAQQQSQITLSQATDIALKDAGVKKSDAKITEAKAEKYDRTPHYEIEFIANAKEYEYEIAMSNGKILKKEVENTSSSKPSADASNYISLDEAKKIALKEAKVSSENAKFIKAELDKDGRTAHYDIEFVSGKYKYEVEINAKTGKVTDYEKDRKPAQPSSKHISAQKAADIALSHAKLDSASVRDLKTDFNKRLFVSFYEVEFESGNYEYEYKINAKTGKIISADKSWD